MSYRRDAKPDESIPLPIETVYNSVTDAITTKDEDGHKDYFRNGIEHFNRIYFNYPPRNKCFPSFRRVTRKVLMSCKMEWVLNVTIVMVRNHDILTTTPYGSIC